MGEGPGAAGFFDVMAEEPKLYIRHSEPVQKDEIGLSGN